MALAILQAGKAAGSVGSRRGSRRRDL